jgi:hypothetical protein
MNELVVKSGNFTDFEAVKTYLLEIINREEFYAKSLIVLDHLDSAFNEDGE